MGVNRRQFLKIAGLSTLLGLGGKTVFELLAPGALEATEAVKGDKRWAIVIDTRKFTDETYKKCIEACHKIHNVPKMPNPRHEVKWIWTDDFEHTFPDQKHEYEKKDIEEEKFLLLCNHCDNPPCCRVCPTQATFKREDGIVMMDPHRCIGCRFCMAACPYGARSFNWLDPKPYIKEINPKYPARTKGVVEKCTLCAERLDKGLLPACVEASEGAMIFGNLADPNSEVRKVLRSNYSIRRKPELGTKPSVFYIV